MTPEPTPSDKPLPPLLPTDDPIIHTTLPPLPPPVVVAPDKPLSGVPVPTKPDVAD